MSGLRAALLEATARLRAAGIDTARLDAELLLAHALGCSRSALLLGLHADTAVPDHFDGLLDRRAAREPLAYIVGEREFWSLPFAVSPAVLIPRPDSETMVEQALAHARARPVRRVLDLGTGSGCLLLAVLSELPDASGIGLDASVAALAVAQSNADQLGLAARARFVAGDWTRRGWPDALGGRFDLILANPPYIPEGDRPTLARDVADHEPGMALFAGADGLDAYRAILPALPELLAPAGLALLEFGLGQGPALLALAQRLGWVPGATAAVHPDLSGRDRVLLLHAQPA